MPLITKYEHAELAMAAYADLEKGDTGTDANFDALRNKDLTRDQAQEFSEKYDEVVDQYRDSSTGFSATLFRAKDSTELKKWGQSKNTVLYFHSDPNFIIS
jgi:hypothetical protein